MTNIVKSPKNLWHEIEPILIHNIVTLILFISVIFFHYVIDPRLHEPFQTIAFSLEVVFFTCSLSLYVFLAIGLIYKSVRKRLKKYDENSQNADDNSNDENSPANLAPDTEQATLNPPSASVNEINEEREAEETVNIERG